jgi:hypothetical protein
MCAAKICAYRAKNWQTKLRRREIADDTIANFENERVRSPTSVIDSSAYHLSSARIGPGIG